MVHIVALLYCFASLYLGPMFQRISAASLKRRAFMSAIDLLSLIFVLNCSSPLLMIVLRALSYSLIAYQYFALQSCMFPFRISHSHFCQLLPQTLLRSYQYFLFFSYSSIMYSPFSSPAFILFFSFAIQNNSQSYRYFICVLIVGRYKAYNLLNLSLLRNSLLRY